jgi:hypothetical protein
MSHLAKANGNNALTSSATDSIAKIIVVFRYWLLAQITNHHQPLTSSARKRIIVWRDNQGFLEGGKGIGGFTRKARLYKKACSCRRNPAGGPQRQLQALIVGVFNKHTLYTGTATHGD